MGGQIDKGKSSDFPVFAFETAGGNLFCGARSYSNFWLLTSSLPLFFPHPFASIPNFRIFACSVVRFIPSFAAAPCGPPTLPSDSRSARSMASASASARVTAAELGVLFGPFNSRTGACRSVPAR